MEGKGEWSSDRQSTKKQAQQEAAQRAFDDLKDEEGGGIATNYKNLLQEFLQKNGQPIPTWSSQRRARDNMWVTKGNNTFWLSIQYQILDLKKWR